MHAPETVHLCADTVVEPGAVIEPFVVFGPGVRIAAGAGSTASRISSGRRWQQTAQIGPYARLRPGSRIGAEARVGNFVEIKNTRAGARCEGQPPELPGRRHHRRPSERRCRHHHLQLRWVRISIATRIGAGAFIGSNTALVAPVSIGEGAVVAAGSTITRDVPDDGFAVARARQEVREHRAAKMRERLRPARRG